MIRLARPGSTSYSISFLVIACTLTSPLWADGDVQWAGVYSDATYREPRYPAAGEDFTVELRVFRGDITGARVRTWDGETRRVDMVWVRNEGAEFDIWRATVDGTSEDTLYYRFEITDRDDTDYYNALGMFADAPTRGDFLINTTPLGRFPLGATLDGAGAVFRVWAPNATGVSVAGAFNGWSTTAHRMTEIAGEWQVRVPSASNGQPYKYVIANDDTHWRTDPRGRAMTSSVGDSRLWRSAYAWTDDDWVTPFFEDMIVYELHVGSFSGEDDGVGHYPGRFRDVVDVHVDHLVDLGINVVELMPITEFAGEMSWGYNPSTQYAPESSYGSPDDLKYLVDRCHRAGIAVILDVVFNHMGGSDLAGNLLDYDGEEIYFYPEGNGFRETPWGPRPDYGRRQVREYLRDAVRYWLEEYHIDGFRLDGTDFVKVNAEGWRLLAEIAETVDTVSRKAIVIAEQLPNDPAITQPIAAGGAGADSQWNDLFHDRLRDAIGAAGFGDPNVSGVADGMNHFAFGGVRAVNYIESHDEAAVHGRVSEAADSGDPHSQWAYGRGKLAWGLVMFTAGIPMVLQGQEWLEDRRFGDAREHRIQWDYRDRYEDFYRAARDMTWLRRTLPALRADGLQSIFHVNDGANVIAWHRWTPAGGDVVIVASFANADLGDYCLGMPQGGRWYESFNSDASVYGGRNHGNAGEIDATGPAMHGLPSSACLTLPRMGVLVFTRDPVDLSRSGFLRADCNGDGAVDISDPIRELFRLFGGNGSTDCPAACDANGDGEENITDVVFTLDLLFRGGSLPPAPWPQCREFAAALECERECD